MNSRDRYGTVNHRRRRLPKKSAIRLGSVENRESVPRRRRVDDHQVVLTGRVEVVELFHGEVVVAVHETARDVLVERIGEDGSASRSVGSVPSDQLVPAGFGVEHRDVQLTARIEAGSFQCLVRDRMRSVAERLEAEGGREATGRIDREHEHPSGLALHRSESEGCGDRGLAHTAGAGDEDHLSTGEQRIQ